MALHDWSLVDSGIFHNFHLLWIGRLNAHLNERILPEPYYAIAEPVLGEAVPDVITLQEQGIAPRDDVAASQGLVREEPSQGAVALAPAPVLVQELGPPDPYALLARLISIRDSLRDDRVVAVIELVSHANKASRVHSERFTEKSLSLLAKGIHLVIIDVQPGTALVPNGFHEKICEAYGAQPPARPENRPCQAASYEVLGTSAVRAHIVALRTGDKLPEMPVFLLPHHFVRLPLDTSYQEAFTSLPRKFRVLLEAGGRSSR
ncbi:MAG: DUF4058 family protein [Planctomycetes bacterium]|nr:DUF4058 family protein [Planctomycetota bacterium]